MCIDHMYIRNLYICILSTHTCKLIHTYLYSVYTCTIYVPEQLLLASLTGGGVFSCINEGSHVGELYLSKNSITKNS